MYEIWATRQQMVPEIRSESQRQLSKRVIQICAHSPTSHSLIRKSFYGIDTVPAQLSYHAQCKDVTHRSIVPASRLGIDVFGYMKCDQSGKRSATPLWHLADRTRGTEAPSRCALGALRLVAARFARETRFLLISPCQTIHLIAPTPKLMTTLK